MGAVAKPHWQAAVTEDLLDSGKPAADIAAEYRIPIRETDDIVKAREAGLKAAESQFFSNGQAMLLMTAISELARNIILYATYGEIRLSRLDQGGQRYVVVTALDSGPGIANIQQALAGGFSTSGGLGLGLSGLNNLVDQLEIESQPDVGTQVIVRISSGGHISNTHNGESN